MLQRQPENGGSGTPGLTCHASVKMRLLSSLVLLDSVPFDPLSLTEYVTMEGSNRYDGDAKR